MQLELSSIHTLRATVDHLDGPIVSTLAIGDECRSLVFNRSGELIFGSSQHVILGTRENWETFLYREPTDIEFESEVVLEVASNSDIIFAAVSDGNVYQITPYQTTHIKMALINFACVSNTPKLCASEEFLAISVGVRTLLIYSLLSKTEHEFVLPNTLMISSSCFDTDGSLLLLDSVKERVSKYRITEGVVPQLLWACDGVKDGLAVCVDITRKHGCIFVTGSSQKIHLINKGSFD